MRSDFSFINNYNVFVLCNRCRSYLLQSRVRWWSAPGPETKRDALFLVCTRLSWALKLDESALVSLVAIIKRMSFAGSSYRNGWVCVEDDPGRRPREFLVCT